MPSKQPSLHPTRQPISLPTSQPSTLPSLQPSSHPSASPTEIIYEAVMFSVAFTLDFIDFNTFSNYLLEAEEYFLKTFHHFIPWLENANIVSVNHISVVGGVSLLSYFDFSHKRQNKLHQSSSSIVVSVNITKIVKVYQRNATKLEIAFKGTKEKIKKILTSGSKSQFQSYFHSLIQNSTSPLALATISSTPPIISKNFVSVNLHSPRPSSTPTSMP
jgi:hypothetical protein